MPCPDASCGRTVHEALIVAVHAHSRVVVTVSVPDAPPSGTVAGIDVSTDTWHLGADGVVTPSELEEQE